jgi:hypothetical protein
LDIYGHDKNYLSEQTVDKKGTYIGQQVIDDSSEELGGNQRRKCIMKLKVGFIMHIEFKEKMMKTIQDPEFKEMDFHPRWYSHEDQSIELTRELSQEIDMILYGGPVPYYLSLNTAPIKVPADFIEHDEVALMRSLFDLQKIGVDITRISVDTLTERTLRDVYDELQMDSSHVVLKPLLEEKIKDDSVTFHIENYRSGNTLFALTGRSLVYEQLLHHQVPCYHMMATNASVRNALNRMVTRYQRKKYQDAQIAIGLLKVKSPDIAQESMLHSRRHQVELHKHLLDYAEKLKAGLMELGEGRFLIYTTYGALKKTTDSFQNISISRLLKDLGVSFSIGIGTGENAEIAEEGARRALIKAEKCGDGYGFIMFENHEMLGPFGHAPTKVIVRSENPHMQALAKELRVTAPILAQLTWLVQEEQKSHFSAEELSTQIGLSPRSARRILHHLLEGGFAEMVGEEMISGLGRPRKIFRIKLGSFPFSDG